MLGFAGKIEPGPFHFMRTGHASAEQKRLPPDLFEPQLAGIGTLRIRLIGLESIEGVAYVQEWMVEFR